MTMVERVCFTMTMIMTYITLTKLMATTVAKIATMPGKSAMAIPMPDDGDIDYSDSFKHT